MNNQFLPANELPYLARSGISDLIVVEDMDTQKYAFEDMNRILEEASPAFTQRWMELFNPFQ